MKRLSQFAFAAAILWAPFAGAVENAAGPNLVRNGSFEEGNGAEIAEWVLEGDEGVEQTLTRDAGVTDGHSARLTCTAFDRQTRESYATLAQYGFPQIEKGKWYRFSCWARQEGMAPGMVTVEMYADMKAKTPYGTALLFFQLPVRHNWQRFERCFRADFDGSDNTKLFAYFDFPGTLWLDDVEVVEIPRPEVRLTSVIPSASGANAVPNAGFELGTYNWSSLGKPAVFAGGLTGLYGDVQHGDAAEGDACLRVELGPGKTPVSSFNTLVKLVEQNAPRAAHIGWIETEVGASYTLSAYMKADKAGVPATLQVRFGAPHEGMLDRQETVTLDTEWKRYTFTCTAEKRYAFAAVGPDLTNHDDPAATVWIDAIQLEKGEQATEFAPREPVEIGLSAAPYGNVFSVDEPVVLELAASNRTAVPARVMVRLTVEDYFDRPVATLRRAIEVPPHGRLAQDWDLGLEDPGFYRVRATWDANGVSHEATLRLAYIRPYEHDDSVFGMNHSPSTDNLSRHMVRAGALWAREWTMEWEVLEPEQGQFRFEAADAHVNRVLAAGMKNVQQLPPFPSVSWNTEAPEGAETFAPGIWWNPYYYAPREHESFANYVKTVVNHFKDRIHVWEYLNEPLYTIHSLPNVNQLDATIPTLPEADYTVEDYIALLKVFHESVKAADPEARTIGGLSARPDLLTEEFCQAGGLDHLDIFNLHIYPGLRRPEGYIPQMEELLRHMDATPSGRKPIWMTEYSYYGSDTLPYEPYVISPVPWAPNRLLRDERECADYSVRYAAIMLAHGVEKICYHWGGAASADPNDDVMILESWMTVHAGVPRKLYAAQAALSDLLGPAPKYAAPLARPEPTDGGEAGGVYGYAFQCGSRAVLIAWAPSDENTGAGWTLRAPAEAECLNIVGAPLTGTNAPLGDSPVYVVSDTLPAEELARACVLEATGESAAP